MTLLNNLSSSIMEFGGSNAIPICIILVSTLMFIAILCIIYNQKPSSKHGDIHKTVPGKKCPVCESFGETIWVIPGKCCPQCNTLVE